MFVRLACLLLSLIASTSFGQTSHEFTDKKGRKLEAQILFVRSTDVELKRVSDGKVFSISKDLLSDDDLKFLTEWSKSEKHATGGVRLRPKTILRSRKEQKLWVTNYGSFDKKFISQGALRITVQNLRRSTSTIKVEWYFLGSNVKKDGEFFAFGGGVETFKIDPLGERTFDTSIERIVKRETNYAALRQKYISGGTYHGWLVQRGGSKW
jgi:hypothetical protein